MKLWQSFLRKPVVSLTAVALKQDSFVATFFWNLVEVIHFQYILIKFQHWFIL